MSRSGISRETLFRILAVLFVGAAIYHAIAFFLSAFSAGGSPWRHGIFCAIDLICAGFLLRRPRWFVTAFGILTLQALNSHGHHAWMLQHEQRRLDWLSFAVLLVMPLTMA